MMGAGCEGRARMNLLTETVDEAVGRTHRSDPVTGTTGGPAGNARLTAWAGAVLFVLLAVEGVTVLAIHGLITWHVLVGVALIPPVLLKTGTTGWRIIRYYRGDRAYRAAGPPPMLLRLLGPLVVVTTLGVLASGLVLVLVGPTASRRPLAGTPLDLVSVHKATFVVWLGVTGVHVVGRLVPALRLVRPGAVPGRSWRAAAMLATLAGAVATAVLVAGTTAPWHVAPEHERSHARHAAPR
jgi:hypothetical protein